jgi:hypothetical protein
MFQHENELRKIDGNIPNNHETQEQLGTRSV